MGVMFQKHHIITIWQMSNMFMDFVKNWMSFSENKMPTRRTCAPTTALGNSLTGPLGLADEQEGSAVRSPSSTRAEGQDDVSSNKLLQIS